MVAKNNGLFLKVSNHGILISDHSFPKVPLDAIAPMTSQNKLLDQKCSWAVLMFSYNQQKADQLLMTFS
jgi:hypothetical protein